MLTVSMIALIVLGGINVFQEGKTAWTRFATNRAYWMTTAIFFIVFLSGLYSSDLSYFLVHLRIKLPFLLMPLAFGLLPIFSLRQYNSLFYWLLVLITISSIGVLINYALNYETFNLYIKQSRAIPTPINHIRYSLLTAVAILGGFLLFQKKFYLKYQQERWAILMMTLFLVISIHLLSVRSGLLALYLSAFVLTMQWIWQTKRYKLGIAVLFLIISLPIFAFFQVKSFRTQLELTLHNVHKFQSGVVGEYSDTQRLVSYEMGLEATQKSPYFGVGMGDIRQEIEAAYQKHYPKLKYKLPHNQFLYFYTGTGLVGMLAFIACFLFPLFYRRHYQNPLFLGLYTIIFCSFMVEATIETAIGTAFYIFFILLSLNFLSGNAANR